MWRLTLSELRGSFADVDIRRGLKYAREGKVLWFERRDSGNDRACVGEVRGSRRQPYRVHVRVVARPKGVQLESHCSCPIQVACKHAAALLVTASGLTAARPNAEQRAALAASAQPTLNHVGCLANVLGESRRVLGLRIGRWLASTEGWNFEDVAFSALSDPGTLVVSAPVQQLIKRLAQQRITVFEGLAWWQAPAGVEGLLLELALEGSLAWRRSACLVAPAPARDFPWRWTIDVRGAQRLELNPGPDMQIARVSNSWLYFDSAARIVGRADPGLSTTLTAELLALPALAADEIGEFESRFGALLPADFPRPRTLAIETPDDGEVVPILTLHQSAGTHESRGQRTARLIAFARLSFRYGPARVGESDPAADLSVFDGHRVRRYRRDRGRERELQTRLKQLGLISNRHAVLDHPGLQQSDWVINPEGDAQTLNEFCFVMLPRLRNEGWRLEYGPRFPLKLIDAEYRFYAQVDESVPGPHIEVEFGIEVDQERINLLPTLRQGLAAGRFDDLPNAADAIVALTLPGERRLPIAAGKLRFILGTLDELHDPGDLQRKTLSLPRFRAGALLELEHELANGRRLWPGAKAVRVLAEKLTRYAGLPATPVPLGLRAELRPYQVEGLAWLRFLGESALSGILADDMGLGKTVQLLAYLIGEKEAGRLDRPALVVCPKSVLPNWEAEIERFTPGLSHLSLAGPERGKRRRSLATVDVVMTTYPVLAREIEALSAQAWHLVVLDESQMVKNPATLAARAARKLDARQRVCLTGTPLENHLGELWAQFDFLLPGLLGTKLEFARNFRKPIEKMRDRDTRERLQRRIRPFLMRRTKDQVVAELPPKTEVTRIITLESRQRELYEQLRETYVAEVKGWIAAQSLERNRMRVLEGLMRLRQVCCDPRLIAGTSVDPRGFNADKPRVHIPSAKLEVLMSMLEELIGAGRRILVFSQFTSMLELIEADLNAKRIRYVKLTGKTEDRALPVQRFQRGEVPLFLISLRAGGFGLNLTQADTVVHYDPWWNPAVEAQATDRAHRIGQDKPVFVYRLIAADTVEERILTMQARKKDLADALFDESGQSLATVLGPDDWLSLLE